MKKFKLIGGGG